MLEYKSCRVPFDIDLKVFECSYCQINVSDYPKLNDLTDNAGGNYEYVTENYTPTQRDLIKTIQYFSVFNQLIINQKQDFFFNKKTKRPPLDRTNAVLSFLYVLLSHDGASALEGVGLDAYVGFMHKDRPGRASLALDLMEEFRSVFADRLALTIINRNEIEAKGFITKDNGAVIMDDDTRKIILNACKP